MSMMIEILDAVFIKFLADFFSSQEQNLLDQNKLCQHEDFLLFLKIGIIPGTKRRLRKSLAINNSIYGFIKILPKTFSSNIFVCASAAFQMTIF